VTLTEIAARINTHRTSEQVARQMERAAARLDGAR